MNTVTILIGTVVAISAEAKKLTLPRKAATSTQRLSVQ